jgi:Protein of unknown function (DUF3179)
VFGRCLLLVALAGALAACGSATPTTAGSQRLGPVPQVDRNRHSVPLDQIVFDTFDGGSVPLSRASDALIERELDRIRPVYRPRYGGAGSLRWLKDDDLVIGVAAGGQAWAYPIKVLNLRELVVDELDGRPVLISYCPLCGSGVVFDRRVGGRTLVFSNTSALFQSDLVMVDRQTGSYWFQLAGQAVVGPLTGTRLRVVPSTTTPWGTWRRLHPETRLLAGEGNGTFGSEYAGDPFSTYPRSLDQGQFAFPVTRRDGRLRAGEPVLVVESGRAAKAYPLRLLGDRVVNDEVGDTPVAVVAASGGFAVAFAARNGGRTLTLGSRGNELVDRQTGTRWSLAGRGLSGPLAGANLRLLPTRRAYWFAAAAANPGIDVYRP